MLFTFPSRYWFTIGLSGVFSLAGWSRRIHAGFLVSRATQDYTMLRLASNTGLVLYLSHSRPSSLTAYPRREVPELSRRLPCVCPEYHIWYLPSFFRRHMRLTSSSHPVDVSGASTMRGGSHEKPSLLNDTAMDFLDRHEKYILYPSSSGRTKTSKHSPSFTGGNLR